MISQLFFSNIFVRNRKEYNQEYWKTTKSSSWKIIWILKNNPQKTIKTCNSVNWNQLDHMNLILKQLIRSTVRLTVHIQILQKIHHRFLFGILKTSFVTCSIKGLELPGRFGLVEKVTGWVHFRPYEIWSWKLRIFFWSGTAWSGVLYFRPSSEIFFVRRSMVPSRDFLIP